MVINSPDVIYELFERRSSIYSDRGESPMLMLFVSRHLHSRSLADPRHDVGWVGNGWCSSCVTVQYGVDIAQ